MLVREDARLTLRDIPEDNWIVVGLYLPESVAIDGLVNGLSYDDEELSFNQEIRLVDASIDTWNLYPQLDANISVRDSVLGEIMGFGRSRVSVERTTIDGSGGFLSARDRAHITLHDSIATCTIEATHDGTIELHDSMADPYPQDVTASYTRFGAYDRGRLFADQSPVNTLPIVGGDGVIAVTYLLLPEVPPVEPFELYGSVGLFSLGGGPVLEGWSLEAIPRDHGPAEFVAAGDSNVEEDEVGVWSDAKTGVDYVLQTVLTDTWGRTLVGKTRVFGDADRLRRVGGRRAP